MTQEEKFKEAKRLYETANADQRYVLESLFPELKESEDEMTRKEITEFFKNFSGTGTWNAIPDVTKWIAWLEKQAQKPAALSEENESRITTICTYLQDYARLSGSESRTIRINEYCDWLKCLKDSITWKPSDEQMNNLEYISTHPSHIDYQNIEIIRSLYNDLKKLM